MDTLEFFLRECRSAGIAPGRLPENDMNYYVIPGIAYAFRDQQELSRTAENTNSLGEAV